MTAARLGLLHTVPALAGTFTGLIQAELPDARLLHLVDADLLATAIRTGVTDEVRARVGAHVAYLAASGCVAILVTCSSIGEAVEEAAAGIDIPVLRVDEPMGHRAVAIAAAAATAGGGTGRIVVLATLDATLGPSARLIERLARSAADADAVEVSSQVVAGAAAARGAGDQESHDALIAAAVEAISAARSADVIVLAQASMADAASGVDTRIPVLSSPRGGVAALVAAARVTAA